MKYLMGLALLCSCVASAAQNVSSPSSSAGLGTSIVGEQEAAIGLFITPWQDESASNVDRPPRLYDVPLEPLNPAAFDGQVQTWQQLEDYRRSLLAR